MVVVHGRKQTVGWDGENMRNGEMLVFLRFNRLLIFQPLVTTFSSKAVVDL